MSYDRVYDDLVSRKIQGQHPNQFLCPYCGKWKDISELETKEEIGNTRIEQGSVLRPNTYKIVGSKSEIPICCSCSTIMELANSKANNKAAAVATIIFVLGLVIWCFSKMSGVLVFIVAIICIFVYIIVKDVLKRSYVKKEGIEYRVTNRF